MKNEEICKAYLDALRAVCGDEIAISSRCEYDRGWFYASWARRYPDGSVGGGETADAYRKNSLLEIIAELKGRVL
jgi:hypothetical protein